MTVTCIVDGASRGQGKRDSSGNLIAGEGACAALIYKNNRLVIPLARGLGPRTNNECEYEAVLLALIFCLGSDNLLDPVIYSDSEMVVKQVNGIWRCNTKSLFPLLLTITEIQSVFRFRLQHAKRKEVAVADTLCNEYLDKLELQQQTFFDE